jgi:excisionase family DNA binding protein
MTYRVDEAAHELSVSRRTVERMISRGEIHAAKVGSTTRIHYKEIDALFEKKPRHGASGSDKA